MGYTTTTSARVAQFDVVRPKRELFRNYHFHSVVSTLTNVVKLYVVKDNVVSTLSNIAHISVEIHNVDSTLFDVVNANVEIHNVVSTLI